MSAYADARPDIARVALIRELTDELVVQFRLAFVVVGNWGRW